jgi:hypothetical protein
MNDGPLDFRDRWMPPTDTATSLVTTELDEMASSSTLRAGRLLAPMAIRFVVVPEFDGVVSTVNDPLPLPAGLIESLEDQLDLVALQPGLPTLEVFENRAWLATASLLQGESAEISDAAGAEVLVRTDLSDATPLFIGADQFGRASESVEAGVVHLAVPFGGGWTLDLDGEPVSPRRAFGETQAFSIETAGNATLEYRTSTGRSLLIALQVVLWAVALLAVGRVRVPIGRRTSTAFDDDIVIDLTSEPPPLLYDPGLRDDGTMPTDEEMS